MSKPIRALHILPQFQPGGGIDSVVLNYLKNLDPEQVQIDVLCHKSEDPAYAEIVHRQGGDVFILPPFTLNNLSEIRKQFLAIIKRNQYDVVHCHMANASFLYLRIAEQYGVPLRVLHSHQDHYADSIVHALRNIPLVAVGKHSASIKLACSNAAGKFLFGSKNFSVLPNAIDTEKFRFNSARRESFRKV